MPTLREIRSRIKGVKTTQQVTKAMKMVAAAKLRRSQDAVLQARPYAFKLKELLESLSQKVDTSQFPLLSPRKEVKSVLVIAVAADRGLCGAFNSNLFKTARQVIDGDYADLRKAGKVKMFCVGKRSVDHFVKGGYDVIGQYGGVFSKMEFATAKAIAERATELYLKGEVDRVIVVYNEFKSLLSSKLKTDVLLPIQPSEAKETKDPKRAKEGGDYIYEPSPEAIINDLAPRHLATQMWRVMLESFAAEQAARMMAMDTATENAKELLRVLSITYNRARQGAITKEIIEIVSGANALQAE
ncbi:MAG: ATP synthase F1 subunit gamma [Chloroherpetonaceae bacterium]|nr:ATP synthase F1 subunit gamma [Chloroherpetonaceae bacterium]MDW8438763.1 ATP synthase F1 subunit gamma [Chloroherpetonaceae bacterium]